MPAPRLSLLSRALFKSWWGREYTLDLSSWNGHRLDGVLLVGGGAGDQAVVGSVDGFRPRKRRLVRIWIVGLLWWLLSLSTMAMRLLHAKAEGFLLLWPSTKTMKFLFTKVEVRFCCGLSTVVCTKSGWFLQSREICITSCLIVDTKPMVSTPPPPPARHQSPRLVDRRRVSRPSARGRELWSSAWPVFRCLTSRYRR